MSLKNRLLSQSTAIFGARIIGAGLTFLAQVAIARFLGAGVLGEYILVMATVNIVAVVMPLGFETIGTYFAAQYRAKGEGRLLRGFIGRAYLHIAISAVVVLVFGQSVAGLFGEPGRTIAAHWVPAAVLAISTALVFVNGALLVGLKRPFAGFFAETIFRPLLALAGFALVLATSVSAPLDPLLWVLAVGYALVALIQMAMTLKSARELPSEATPNRTEWRRWWHFAVPWIAIVVAGDFFFDIDLLLLSGHLSHEEIAIFGVCTRVFSLVSFGVGSVYAVTMPDMFESEALADRRGFHTKVGEANVVASGLSVLLLAAVVVLSPLAFMLFGGAFQAGVVPLGILCVGLVMRSVFGPASVVLSVHNRPYASLPAIGLGMATLVAANMVLVPVWGLLGASVGALLSMTVWSAAMWFTALKVSGVDVSILARLRPQPVMTAHPAE